MRIKQRVRHSARFCHHSLLPHSNTPVVRRLTRNCLKNSLKKKITFDSTMDAMHNEAAFLKLVDAMKGVAPIPDESVEVVKLFAHHEIPRIGCTFPYQKSGPRTVAKLIEKENVTEYGGTNSVLRCRKLEEGLEKLKWSMWKQGPHNLGSGKHGIVQLIPETVDKTQNLPFPKRRMAALKIQQLDDNNVTQCWTEMKLMKCIKHENIVDYYDALLVLPQELQADSPGHEKESEKALDPGQAQAKSVGTADA